MERKKSFITLLALITAVMSAFVSCDTRSSGTENAGVLVPKIHFQQEDEVFGLYAVSENGIITAENVRMEADGSLEKTVYYSEGTAYFVYSPYTDNPEGMPALWAADTNEYADRFFRPLAEKTKGQLRVAKGIHLCKGKSEVSFRIAPWRDY